MEVYLSMDKQRLDKKPKEGLAIAEVKKRTATGWQKIGICEAADLIGEKGYAVIPGRMEGGIKAKNCTAMQVFLFHLYTTHTALQKEEERFRVAFVHAALIEDSYIILESKKFVLLRSQGIPVDS